MIHHSSDTDLIGRKDDIDALWKILEESSRLLVGPRRIGKTWLIKAMARERRGILRARRERG